MSTPPVVPTVSKTTLILAIINAALTGLAAIPGAQLGSALGLTFISILQNGMIAYQQETGKPLDLTLIPLETPVS